MAHKVRNPITGIKVMTVFDDCSPAAPGTGKLTVHTVDTVAWTPPGGTEGTPVALFAKFPVILTGDGGTGRILIMRTSDDDLEVDAVEYVYYDGVKSNHERLIGIDKAIEAAQKAQEMKSGTDELIRARIDHLNKQRKEILASYERETGKSAYFYHPDLGGRV